MAVPTTNTKLTGIQTEFGGSNPISISEYYSGGPLVPSASPAPNGPIPSSGAITVGDFRGATKARFISASGGTGTSIAYGASASFAAAGTGLAVAESAGAITYTITPNTVIEAVDTATTINITSSWVENFTSTQILNISGAIDAATGSFSASITGTANEVKVTSTAPGNIVIGLPTNVTIGGTLDINGATLATDETTFNLIDTNATTINFGGAATTIDIGAAGASNVNILGSASIAGDLTVNGTTTSINTTNLNVEDQFILLASSSGAPNTDGGIIIQTGTGGTGTALFFDDSVSRWGLTKKDDTAWNATSVTPRQYVVSVSSSAANPTSTPSDFGVAAASYVGMMYVATTDNDGDTNTIWIYG